MIQYSVNAKLEATKIILRNHGLDENGKLVRKLRNDVARYSDPYVPFDTGQLKNNITYPSNHEIKYTTPYAHYHYIGKKAVGASRPKGVKRTISSANMNYNGAPKRGPQWDKRMWNDRGNDICKNLEEYLKKGQEE